MADGLTYSLFPPIRGVPHDVVSSLMARAENLGGHVLVFGKPDLKLLVPSPVPGVSKAL